MQQAIDIANASEILSRLEEDGQFRLSTLVTFEHGGGPQRQSAQTFKLCEALRTGSGFRREAHLLIERRGIGTPRQQLQEYALVHVFIMQRRIGSRT
ncbi:hypothetical protein ACFTZB_04745 [Rhodococcus sp. NPDC057014]|uniref:hypothetical protein n=1 Tax=Rhodococcus sp. NPDC057014 TaxID=3346000 RepID=UPI003633C12B